MEYEIKLIKTHDLYPNLEVMTKHQGIKAWRKVLRVKKENERLYHVVFDDGLNALLDVQFENICRFN